MKTIGLILAFTLLLAMTNAKTHISSNQEHPEVGDTLIILENSGSNYRYIDFPRLNILAKRGHIASYKSIYHKEVVVKEVIKKHNGRIDIKLKRADGEKFFNQKQYVKANYFKAIEKKELKIKS